MPRRVAPCALALLLAAGCPGDPGASTTDASTGGTGGTGSTGTDGTATVDPTSTTAAPTTTTLSTTTGAPTSTGGTTGEPDHYPDADPLFDLDAIAEFDITLSDNALLALDADPRTYTAGDLVAKIGGQLHALPGIGVRLKGNYGSFRELDQKAAFLLDFNRYDPDQELLGLTKLAVNNMVQDCSMQREILGYMLLRDAGVPAPRAGYVVVRVNGEPYGLYTAVESADNNVFLDHWFGGHGGNLYEGAYGSDIVTELVPSFDQDNGDDIALADLFAWAAALDAITDPDRFTAAADALMDLDRVLAMFAGEIYLGHWDGYAWTRNNYYVYSRESDARWLFLPWGIDQTLRDHMNPFGGDGRIQQMCAASVACRMLLAAHFEDYAARVDALDLVGVAEQLRDLTADAVAADPRKECDVNAHDGDIDGNIDFLLARKDSIIDGLLCTVPSDVDADMDGYSACTDDCNDGDADVHPGAPEQCDLDDDNCDGVWDDDPMCPSCASFDLPGPGTARFCFVARTFAEADADCQTQGGELLSIHSQAIQDFTAQQAFDIAASDWWIGINDIQQEGTFVWSDGTPVDFTAWNEGEPNNAGDEDCVNLPYWTGGLWNDLGCDAVRPYICRLP